MLRYLAQRLAYAVATIFAVSVIVYLIFSLLPLDPAALTCGTKCTPEIVKNNRIQLGLDKPLIEQYWLFLSGIFVGRDYGVGQAAFSCPAPAFGYSFNNNMCVTEMITEALPITVQLALGAMVIWLTVGIGLGIVAAKFRGKIPDTASSIFVLLGTSLPTFVTGIALIVWVSIKWELIPPSLDGYVSFFDDPKAYFYYFILAWITLAIAYAAFYTRFTRASVLEVMGEDYIRTARAKGLKERTVLMKHTMRAVLAPLVTSAGLDFAGLMGGAIITESLFNLPGLGRLTLRSISQYDLSVIVATVLLAAVIVIVMNLIVDLLYGVLDPRVRVK